jgi:hypothetical protein
VAYPLSLLSPNGFLCITAIQPQQEDVAFTHLIEIGELLGNQIKAFSIHSSKNILLYFSHRMMRFAIRLMSGKFRLIVGALSVPMFFFSVISAYLCNIFTSSRVRSQFVKSNIGLTIKMELCGDFEKKHKTSENRELI